MPGALRKRIQADAERCGRSFEGQVIALLGRHSTEKTSTSLQGPPGFSRWQWPASLRFRFRNVSGSRRSSKERNVEPMNHEPAVFDTGTLSELSRGNPHGRAQALAYLNDFGRLTITAVTVFERLRGYRVGHPGREAV